MFSFKIVSFLRWVYSLAPWALTGSLSFLWFKLTKLFLKFLLSLYLESVECRIFRWCLIWGILAGLYPTKLDSVTVGSLTASSPGYWSCLYFQRGILVFVSNQGESFFIISSIIHRISDFLSFCGGRKSLSVWFPWQRCLLLKEA